MTEPRRGPTIIEDLDEMPEAPASAAEAPPVDLAPEPAAMGAVRLVASPPSWLARLFWGALVSFVMMAAGLWFFETVEALLARNVWLGRIGFALVAIIGATLLALTLREAAAFARISRIEALREMADRARRTGDRASATAVLDALTRLYRRRPDLAAPTAAAGDLDDEVFDGDAILDAAERRLMTPLDEAAEQVVSRSARTVATVTALAPLALIDVLTALYVNLRMIREIAEIYGGRAGWLGSWRLMRAVAAHLVAAGAMAIGDDLIGPALGGGVLSKVSRRFGEGLVNGALTARIGVAAMEVCRPLAFSARPKPGVSGVIRKALGGIVASQKQGKV